jgi:hypothetical protein
MRPGCRKQFLLDDLRLGKRTAGEYGLLVQDFLPHDLVDPRLVDAQLAQLVGDRDRIAAGPEESRRALQHRDVAALGGDRRDQGCRGRTRADHDNRLPSIVEILRPILRVNDPALEVLHSAPVGGVALRMTVVALAHPQEIRGETHCFAGVGPGAFERPELGAARPAGRGDRVPVTNVMV